MVIRRAPKGSGSLLSRRRLLDGNDKSLLAILQLAILALSGLSLLFSVFLTLRVNAIVTRRPTFAQLTNGETLYISERDRNYRHPEVIRKTVNDWTLLTFNWDGTLPGSDEPDEGVGVPESRARVPFSMSVAALMLEPDFGAATLRLFAEELVPSGVFTGDLRQVVTIEYLSEPRQIAEGRWQVDMLATRRLIDRRDGASQPLAFNRTFTLQAVEIPQSPLGAEASLVEQLVYDTLGAGLQITDIAPYTP